MTGRCPLLKKYKIKKNSYDNYSAKYYKVKISDMKGEFYILIPDYDWEIFNNLAHVHIED